MPYKHETQGKLIPRVKGLDKRIKLTDADKAAIIEAHKGGASINGLAREYGVNKRLVQFILFPERQERGGTACYYDKDKHAESMREHRRYKAALDRSGLLDD